MGNCYPNFGATVSDVFGFMHFDGYNAEKIVECEKKHT